MDIEDWKHSATENNGILTVWVDQTSSLKIKKAASKGVCFAMSLDFALKFQAGGTSPFHFVNNIRFASTISKGKNNIPDVYIIKQNLYKAELAASTNRINILQQQIKAAEIAQKAALEKKLTDLNQLVIRNRFGAQNMKDYISFKADFILNFPQTLDQKMDEQVKANGPSYFLVSMTNPGKGGHAIVFSQRPDLNASKFPGVYEYFDANLGLFIFPSKADLFKFFSDYVCPFYLSKDYSVFSFASYIALGNERHNP
jgi:hypothetical protein